MMAASRVSRKTMKKMGTENTFFPIFEYEEGVGNEWVALLGEV